MSGTVTASSGPKTADLTPPGIQAWSKPTYLKTKSKNTTKQNISLQMHTAPCRQGMNHTQDKFWSSHLMPKITVMKAGR